MILFFIVLCYIVLYCIVLYCIVLYYHHPSSLYIPVNFLCYDLLHLPSIRRINQLVNVNVITT